MKSLSKEYLLKLIQESNGPISITIALSNPGDDGENMLTRPINDFIRLENGGLELWYNTGYEI